MLIVNKRRPPIHYLPTPEEEVVWSGAERLPPGWLPAGIGGGTIRWVRVGSQYPTAPFFGAWVAALRASVATPRENETDLSSLARSVAHLPEVEPAGIIFHVSRCGSTLLSNALSSGENVLAVNEASAIDQAMRLAANPGPRGMRTGAAELYACWLEGAPRSPQWDDHETLLLQIEGKKEWQLFEPTASHPIAGSPAPPPLGEARWRGTLAPGDLLYVPRGWWYQDKALAEPALYLALTFQNLKAIDMIARLLLQAQGQQLLRRDVPWFEGAEAQSSFLTTVQQEVVSLANGPGFLTETLRLAQESSDPRAEFNFPWSGAASPLPPGNQCQLVPLPRFPAAFSRTSRDAADHIALAHNGAAVMLEREAGEILELICASSGATVGSLLEECENKMPRDRIVAHLAELVRLGLVAARPPGESPDAVAVA